MEEPSTFDLISNYGICTQCGAPRNINRTEDHGNTTVALVCTRDESHEQA